MGWVCLLTLAFKRDYLIACYLLLSYVVDSRQTKEEIGATICRTPGLRENNQESINASSISLSLHSFFPGVFVLVRWTKVYMEIEYFRRNLFQQ